MIKFNVLYHRYKEIRLLNISKVIRSEENNLRNGEKNPKWLYQD